MPQKAQYLIYILFGFAVFFDMIYWGSPNNIQFVRYSNFTSYHTLNEQAHVVHYSLLTVLWIFMFILACFWASQKKFKRDIKFVQLVFLSNLLALASSLPDCFQNLVNTKYAYIFYCFGVMCAYLVIYIASSKYSAFFITINSISNDIFTNFKTGLVVFNAKHKLDIINTYAQDLLNIDDSHSHTLRDLFQLNGSSEETIYEYVNEKDSTDFRFTSRNSQKSCLVNISIKRDRYQEPIGYIVAVTDLTEENRLIEEAQAANKAKSNFLSHISHEIRTPINAIIGMNEMILRECSDPSILEYSQNINTASTALLGLVNDVLDISKIESGKLDIIENDYSITDVITSCYQMAISRTVKKNQEFILDIAPEIPAKMLGDELRLRQIITNLLTNAIKYTPDNGKIGLTVKCNTIDTNNVNLSIIVSDTGIGIREADIKEIFKTFTRLELNKNRNIEGTGLGLAITNSIVKLMNGTLDVKSIYKEGSTFSVVIPQQIIDPTPIGEFKTKLADQNPKKHIVKNYLAPDASILVVDDSAMNIDVFVGLLKHTTIQIFTAMDGYEALDKIRRYKYDIIFLDHMMPGIDGVEVLNEMKKITNSPNTFTPVIMLTANVLMGADQEYLSVGFTDYLSKPIKPDLLDNMVLKYLPEDMIQYINTNATTPTTPMSSEKIDETNALLSKLEGTLDTKLGLEYCAGDIDFYQAMINTYLEENKTGKMMEYFSTKDWSNYRIIVHALKGTSLTIGATKLSEEAKGLEFAVKEDNINHILTHHDEVLAHYQTLLDTLEKKLQS